MSALTKLKDCAYTCQKPATEQSDQSTRERPALDEPWRYSQDGYRGDDATIEKPVRATHNIKTSFKRLGKNHRECNQTPELDSRSAIHILGTIKKGQNIVGKQKNDYQIRGCNDQHPTP